MHEWSPRDRGLAVALIQFEASICGGCGQPLPESTDEDGPEYSAEDDHCRGCATLHDASSENDKPGTQWRLDVKRRRS